LKFVGPIGFDPQNPIAVYAGSTGCGLSCVSSLYKSNDGGTTWTYAGFTYSLLGSIAVDTTSAITVAALGVVFRSTDGGLTWIEFDDGLLGNSANWLELSQTRLYAATDQGVFVAAVGPPPTLFHTIFPCRLVDTREANGPYGGPALSGAVDRAFVIRGQCAIPDTARAVAFNLTITQPSASGDLRVYRQGIAISTTSVLNWRSGQTRANSALLSLGASGEIVVHVDQGTGGVHLVIDATGYFE
jgi:hypothetical protein